MRVSCLIIFSYKKKNPWKFQVFRAFPWIRHPVCKGPTQIRDVSQTTQLIHTFSMRNIVSGGRSRARWGARQWQINRHARITFRCGAGEAAVRDDARRCETDRSRKLMMVPYSDRPRLLWCPPPSDRRRIGDIARPFHSRDNIRINYSESVGERSNRLSIDD